MCVCLQVCEVLGPALPMIWVWTVWYYVHFIVFYSEQQELPRMLQEKNRVDSPEELSQLQDELYKIEARLTSKAEHIQIIKA